MVVFQFYCLVLEQGCLEENNKVGFFMCGITGYFSYNGIDYKAFARANNIIRHRGPDDFGYLVVAPDFTLHTPRQDNLEDNEELPDSGIGAFGFRRLSIIDLSWKGHQPMSYLNNNLWIIYNGEIYNYLELKAELIQRGYVFKSDTDTEVVLASYAEWGVDCLSRFNGMWAFAILDKKKRRLFCSRDRLGIKPLYYFYDGTRFAFGSEVKQLLELFPNLRSANETVLYDYLALGAYGNETNETFFKYIYKLPAGSYFMVDLNEGVHISRKESYWDIPTNMVENDNEISIYSNIHELLSNSIKLRLRSDVSLGVCLSGGIDSSGIAMLAGEIRKPSGTQLDLFTIGSIDPVIDETRYAESIAQNLISEHFVKTPDSHDLTKDLAKFIWHHDEPLIKASMFGGYHVYKLAKNAGATVVLDGQGADELMGGYNVGVHYNFLSELFFSGKLDLLKNELKENSKLYGVDRFHIVSKILWQTFKKKLKLYLSKKIRPNLLKSTCGWLKDDYVMNGIEKSAVLNKKYLEGQHYKFSSEFKQNSLELTKFTNLPGILRQVDRNSMAFSVEARTPFLDYRLVEYLFRLPAQYHMRSGYTKYAYRKAMQGIIPENILWRTDKQGFSMPDRLLLKNAGSYVDALLNTIPEDSMIFDKKEIKKRFDDELSNEALYRPVIWRVVNTLVWQQQFKMIP